jgi:hypothetical protein
MAPLGAGSPCFASLAFCLRACCRKEKEKVEAYLHGKPAFVAKCSRLVKTKAFDNFIIFVVCTRLD